MFEIDTISNYPVFISMDNNCIYSAVISKQNAYANPLQVQVPVYLICMTVVSIVLYKIENICLYISYVMFNVCISIITM